KLTEEQPWWHSLLQLTLGKIDISHVLEKANTDEKRCQAHYYAGMRLLAEGKDDEPRTEFEACLEFENDIFERRIAEQIRNTATVINDKASYSQASILNHQVTELLRQRRHREAVALALQAHEFISEHFQENSAEFRHSLYNLGAAYYLSGD